VVVEEEVLMVRLEREERGLLVLMLMRMRMKTVADFPSLLTGLLNKIFRHCR
jgi:hypothetical protein